jgi:hypothetical protein
MLTDTVVVLLDPLPYLIDSKVVEETEYLNGHLMQSEPLSSSTDTIPAFAPLALAPRTPIKFNIPNKLKATKNEIGDFETLVNASSSTSADMETWIMQDRKQPSAGSKDPMLTLLRIAYFDTVHYLDNLDWTLDEILRDSLDESIMTRRLPAWRKLLNDMEIEIPALGHNLGEFMDSDHSAYREAKTILHNLQDKRIPDFLKRVRAVHATLRSEMALLDSSRSIKEARTMARLTELAFVFIPLTFASSLFSMQVIELEAGISLWIFVFTALGLGMFTYAARGLLQSDFLPTLHRRVLNSLLATGPNPTAQSVSTVQIVERMAVSIWRYSQPALDAVVFVLVLALPVVPIAFMWNRNTLDVGFHVVVTLLILPPGIAVAYFATTAFREFTRSEKEDYYETDNDNDDDDDDETRPSSVEPSFYEKSALAIARVRAKFSHSATTLSESSFGMA